MNEATSPFGQEELVEKIHNGMALIGPYPASQRSYMEFYNLAVASLEYLDNYQFNRFPLRRARGDLSNQFAIQIKTLKLPRVSTVETSITARLTDVHDKKFYRQAVTQANLYKESADFIYFAQYEWQPGEEKTLIIKKEFEEAFPEELDPHKFRPFY